MSLDAANFPRVSVVGIGSVKSGLAENQGSRKREREREDRRFAAAGPQISQLEQKGDPTLGTQTAQPAPASTSGASAPALTPGPYHSRTKWPGADSPSVTASQPGGQQDKAEVGETLLTERAEIEHAS